ncbi:MAG: hypothetical protein GWP05_09805 [Anaerolineaceae bacterium]|nr:hypothetical protein [Anaerolineaceae bacterium]
MNHLTEEQIDRLMAGHGPEPSHLAECVECWAALDGRRAMRQRLQGALASVRPPAGLAARLRRQSIASAPGAPARSNRPGLGRRRFSRVWTALAAAALLFLAVTLGLRLLEANPAQAAADALVKIHQANLLGQDGLYAESDPAKLARYLESKLGFAPLAPGARVGVKIRGGILCRFQDKPGASYVLDTPQGPVSIIVLSELLGCLGDHDGPTCAAGGTCTCRSGQCNIAKVELGGRSYIAVGEQPAAYLAELLASLSDSDAP